MRRRFRIFIGMLAIGALSLGASADQGPQLSRVMRAKLERSQAILGAVVTSNWQLLDRESREMALVVRDPAWSSLVMPEYVRHSEAFLRATDDLVEAAKSRDLEAASLGLVSLTTSCVSCHRYLARSRIVTGLP